MSMQDPIADMLTRIRNSQMAKHPTTKFYFSKIKQSIVDVLKAEGFIEDYQLITNDGANYIEVKLKYLEGRPVIERIKRISRPGLRVYKTCDELVPVPGFGMTIISTSKGVITDKQASELRIGGELLCEVA